MQALRNCRDSDCSRLFTVEQVNCYEPKVQNKAKQKKEEISQGFSDVKSDPRFLNSYVLHMNTVVFVGGGHDFICIYCSMHSIRQRKSNERMSLQTTVFILKHYWNKFEVNTSDQTSGNIHMFFLQ